MLLDKSRTLKIADFGVARVEASNPSDMTGETGTLGYMAPEVRIFLLLHFLSNSLLQCLHLLINYYDHLWCLSSIIFQRGSFECLKQLFELYVLTKQRLKVLFDLTIILLAY